MSIDETHEQPPLWVFDRSDQPVGQLDAWIRSERTGEPRALSIQLDPDTRACLGDHPETVEVAAERILSMRRDRITLDHDVSELDRFTATRDPADAIADAA